MNLFFPLKSCTNSYHIKWNKYTTSIQLWISMWFVLHYRVKVHYFYFHYITFRVVKRFLFNKSADVFTLFRWIERFRRQTSLYVVILITCDDNVRGFVGRRLYTSIQASLFVKVSSQNSGLSWAERSHAA